MISQKLQLKSVRKKVSVMTPKIYNAFNFNVYKRSKIPPKEDNFSNKSEALNTFISQVEKLLAVRPSNEIQNVVSKQEDQNNKIYIIRKLVLNIKNTLDKDYESEKKIYFKNANASQEDAKQKIYLEITNNAKLQSSIVYLCGNDGRFVCTNQKVTRGTINMLYYLWSEYRKITQQCITTDNYSQFTKWLGLLEYDFPMEAILNQSKPKEYFNSISKISTKINYSLKKAEILDFGFKTGYAAANQFNYTIDQSVSAVSKNPSNSQQIVGKNIDTSEAQVNGVQQEVLPIVLKRLLEYPKKKYFESEKKNQQYLIQYLNTYLNTVLIDKYIAEKPKLLLFIRRMLPEEIISAIIMIKKYSEKNKQISLRTVIYILKINHMNEERLLVWKKDDSKKVAIRKITELMYKHMILHQDSIIQIREERDSMKSMLTRHIHTLIDVRKYDDDPETFFNNCATKSLFMQVQSSAQLIIDEENRIQIFDKFTLKFENTELSSRFGGSELRGQNLITEFKKHMLEKPTSNLYEMLTKPYRLSDEQFKNTTNVTMLYTAAFSSLDCEYMNKYGDKYLTLFQSPVLNRFIVYIDCSH